MTRLLLPLVAFGLTGADFDRDVAPLLARRCLDCHSGPAPKGRLDLSRQKTARAALAGKLDDAALWQRVRDDEMPPKKPLPAAEKEVLRRWVESGARWGADPIDPFRVSGEHRAGYDWWSLRPVSRPTPPLAGVTARTPIDAFLLARLKDKGLSFSPEADRRTLVRRLTFDLTGLPPSVEEAEAFVHDDRPGAYERLVDRLLASPAHGERFARHWLDVVRFGESDGFERDLPRFHAWPYRDWVARVLNADLPYDEFARRQLAGDVTHGAAGLPATGFLVAGPHDIVVPVGAVMKAAMRQDELEDLVGTVGQTFLGLTVQCARCHDHKFDPVPQRDYYRLAAALSGVRHGERSFSTEQAQTRLARLKKRAEAARRLAVVAGLAGELAGLTGEIEPLQREVDRRIYAASSQPVGPTHVLLRGDVTARGELVIPGVIAALAPSVPASLSAGDDGARRLALARWLTDARNPLFARVIVNRAWQWHFGVGLVDTPSDFGFNGGRPSHPELLDWLAGEFVRTGWSLKALHRLIVTSAAYRQSSRPDVQAIKLDADNRLLWRKSPTRLEAEAVRDAVLAVTGSLDRAMGGPPYLDFKTYFFKGTQFYDALEQVGPEFHRRSLYRMWARGGRSPFLDTLDCPDPSATTPRRAVTTTPLQALALLNNAFVLDQSERLAERLRAETADVGQQVRLAYRLAFARDPDDRELPLLRSFVGRHGLEALGRVIFNTNEFVQVE